MGAGRGGGREHRAREGDHRRLLAERPPPRCSRRPSRSAPGEHDTRRRCGRRPGPLSERLRPHLTGWLFALPFLVIFLVFLAVPILASFLLSFTGFGIANLRDWFSAEFVGLDNYTRLADDERFLKAARNTAVFVVIGVPFTLALGLLAAVGLNQAIGRIQAFFRVGYYLPVVTSIVAIAVIWRYLLHPDYGLVNGLLEQIGIDGPNWLGQRSTALPSIVRWGSGATSASTW